MPANKYQSKVRDRLIRMMGCSPTYSEVRKNGTVRYKWTDWRYRQKLGLQNSSQEIAKHFEEKAALIKGKGIAVATRLNTDHWPGPYLAVSVAPIGGVLKLPKRKPKPRKVTVQITLETPICLTGLDDPVTETREYNQLLEDLAMCGDVKSHYVISIE